MKPRIFLAFITVILFCNCSQQDNEQDKNLVLQELEQVQSVETVERSVVLFTKSIDIQLDTVREEQWKGANEQLFNQYNRLLNLQDLISSTPLDKPIDQELLIERYPFFSWECEDLFCDVYLNYGHILKQTKRDTSSFTRFLELQCLYFPIDSIEYRLSSQYIIDGSNIYNILGDFGYLKRLRMIDSLRVKGVGAIPLNSAWRKTCDELFSMEYPFWYNHDKVLDELDSLMNMKWSANEKAFKVELSVFQKRIADRAASDLNYFNNRSGLIYE